jgi:hypothetical protein
MAKRQGHRRAPSPKAKKAYYKNVVKAYNRLHNVLEKKNPGALRIHHG